MQTANLLKCLFLFLLQYHVNFSNYKSSILEIRSDRFSALTALMHCSAYFYRLIFSWSLTQSHTPGNYKPILHLINLDRKILNKLLANQFKQCRKIIIHHLYHGALHSSTKQWAVDTQRDLYSYSGTYLNWLTSTLHTIWLQLYNRSWNDNILWIKK